MSISGVLNNLIGRTPLSASFPAVSLKVEEHEPLVGKEYTPQPESAKCELRIDGMTCGSCVEVRALALGIWMLLMWHRLSRVC